MVNYNTKILQKRFTLQLGSSINSKIRKIQDRNYIRHINKP